VNNARTFRTRNEAEHEQCGNEVIIQHHKET
jgi:hypothetical protein